MSSRVEKKEERGRRGAGGVAKKKPSNVVRHSFRPEHPTYPPAPQTHALVFSTQERGPGGPGAPGAGCLWEQGVEKVLNVSSPLTPQC